MGEREAKHILKNHGLRCTAFREKVVEAFLSQEAALSQKDIERIVGECDRVTLYRTIKSYEDVGLIHSVISDKGEQCFALCFEQCTADHHKHNHVHFQCERCGNLYCIEMDAIEIPKSKGNYIINDVEILLKGICENCR